MQGSVLRHTVLRVAALALALFGLAGLAGCGEITPAAPAQQVSGGNQSQGAQAIRQYGCGTCHTIPGIDGATANVGPPLTGIGAREYIAGLLQNTPTNLEYWVRFPQKVVPGVDMPDMGVTARDARDIAAYLYTLR